MSRLNEELKIRISPEDKERISLKVDFQTADWYVRQLTVMLRRCTNNLNQYARRANETGSIHAADIEDLQNRMDEIWELPKQSLARLA